MANYAIFQNKTPFNITFFQKSTLPGVLHYPTIGKLERIIFCLYPIVSQSIVVDGSQRSESYAYRVYSKSLAVSRQIIRLHGGFLRLKHNEEGRVTLAIVME